MVWAILSILVTAFPSVQVGMTRKAAMDALGKDALSVCDSVELPESDPLLGGAVSGVVACRGCPCPPHLASLIVWFGASGKVTGVAVVQPRQKPDAQSGDAGVS